MSEQRLIDANTISVPFNHESDEFVRGILYACDYISNEELPVDAVPVVHGRWVEDYAYSSDPHDRLRYKCSMCGRIERSKEPYCHCGARIDG
jgi:hypothetical protein